MQTCSLSVDERSPCLLEQGRIREREEISCCFLFKTLSYFAYFMSIKHDHHINSPTIITERQEASLLDQGRKKTCIINSLLNYILFKLTHAQTYHIQVNKCRAKGTHPHFSHSQSFSFVYSTGSSSVAKARLELTTKS